MKYWILNQGVPEPTDDAMVWAQWFENSIHTQERVVHQTPVVISPEIIFEISTVFIGLDYQFGTGPPLLYETMVFSHEPGLRGSECLRYTTREQAEAGHWATVAKFRKEIHVSE